MPDIVVARLVTPLVADPSQFNAGLISAGKMAQKFTASMDKVASEITRSITDSRVSTDIMVNALGDITDKLFELVDQANIANDIAFDASVKATQRLDNAQEKVTKTTTSWAEKIKTVLVQKGLNLMISAAKSAAQGLVNLGRGFAKLAVAAAPLPGIGTAFESLAKQTGLSLDALNKAAGGTISQFDLMRRSNEALAGTTGPLMKALGQQLPALLETARAAARATGKDVNFLFESLVNGVRKGSPELIDNAQLILKVGEANAAMAAELDKSVENLTSQETSIALLNATVAGGADLIAQFGGAQLTTAEKVQRLTATLQNLRDKGGVALAPVLGNVANRLADLGTRVLPLLVSFIETKVAPALDVMVDFFGNIADTMLTAATATEKWAFTTVDAFGNVVPVVADAGESMIQKFGRKMAEGAEKALGWGIGIATEFATGLVQGAAQALTAAMQFIGSLLSGWMAPASPPRIFPDIDKAGAATFEEYLEGFSKASFDTLEGLQKPLQNVLSTLVSAGTLGADASAKAFAGLSTELSAAIAGFEKTGKVAVGIFDRLEQAGGKFGSQLSELARRQFAVAKATRDVALAEENLAKAREENEKAQDTVSALAEEFNELLRAGADPAILDAKRAEFEAAKDQLALSEEQVAAAEDEKAAAEEKISPLEEQAQLQQRLLDQLLQMEQAGEKVADATKEIAAGLSAGIGAALADIGVPELPPIAPLDFSKVSESFTAAKADIFAKFEDLFKPVTDAWEKEIQPTLDTLGEEWEKFTGIVEKFWEEKVEPIIEPFKKLLPEDLPKKLGKFTGIVLIVAAGLGILFLAFSILTSPIILLAAGIVILIALWDDAVIAWQALVDITEVLGTAIGTKLREKFDEVKLAIRNLLIDWKAIRTFIRDKFSKTLSDLKTNILDPVLAAFTFIDTAIKNLVDRLAKFIDKFAKLPDLPDWLKPGSPPPLAFALQDISAAMKELNQMDLPEFAASISRLPIQPGGGEGGGSTTNNFFEQNINTGAGIAAVTQGFEVERSMVQAS